MDYTLSHRLTYVGLQTAALQPGGYIFEDGHNYIFEDGHNYIFEEEPPDNP